MSLRSEIEADIISLYDNMDSSGKNTERMKNFMKTMDDKKFYKYFLDFFQDPDKNFTIGYIPFEHGMDMDTIHDIAKKQNVEIYEYVFRPDINMDIDNPVGTVCKIPVIDYPIKRLQQMLFKKNHTTVSITKRNQENGQVTSDDKAARITDVETYSLLVQNQYNAAREYYTFRSDDMPMKTEALKQIAENGEVSLDDLTNDSMNKTTLNTINYYLLGACMTSNMIESSGYLLPNTINAREEKQVTIKR